MKMKDASQIPYGVQDFARIRREGYYYVDKTAYVRTVEQAGSFLFFVRPRRFGKSLFLDMLRCYYDVNEKRNFRSLFFYYGIVSMSERVEGKVAYRIPNHCVRQQVFEYLRRS